MFNKTLINKPATSSIKEAALSSSLRTVIFVRTIESFMFHGAMAFRADQRELHSSCSAPHSAFASARLMALRWLVAGRALFFQPASIFPDVWFTSMAGFLIHFSRCARRTTNGSHLRAKANDSRAVAVRVKILNFALCETHCQNSKYRTFPGGICKRTFPSKGWWGWESVCWLVIGITFLENRMLIVNS